MEDLKIPLFVKNAGIADMHAAMIAMLISAPLRFIELVYAIHQGVRDSRELCYKRSIIEDIAIVELDRGVDKTGYTNSAGSKTEAPLISNP